MSDFSLRNVNSGNSLFSSNNTNKDLLFPSNLLLPFSTCPYGHMYTNRNHNNMDIGHNNYCPNDNNINIDIYGNLKGKTVNNNTQNDNLHSILFFNSLSSSELLLLLPSLESFFCSKQACKISTAISPSKTKYVLDNLLEFIVKGASEVNCKIKNEHENVNGNENQNRNQNQNENQNESELKIIRVNLITNEKKDLDKNTDINQKDFRPWVRETKRIESDQSIKNHDILKVIIEECLLTFENASKIIEDDPGNLSLILRNWLCHVPGSGTFASHIAGLGMGPGTGLGTGTGLTAFRDVGPHHASEPLGAGTGTGTGQYRAGVYTRALEKSGAAEGTVRAGIELGMWMGMEVAALSKSGINSDQFGTVHLGSCSSPNVLWAYQTMRTLLCSECKANVDFLSKYSNNGTDGQGGDEEQERVPDRKNKNQTKKYQDPLQNILSEEILVRLLKISSVSNVSLRFCVYEIITLFLSRIVKYSRSASTIDQELSRRLDGHSAVHGTIMELEPGSEVSSYHCTKS